MTVARRRTIMLALLRVAWLATCLVVLASVACVSSDTRGEPVGEGSSAVQIVQVPWPTCKTPYNACNLVAIPAAKADINVVLAVHIANWNQMCPATGPAAPLCVGAVQVMAAELAFAEGALAIAGDALAEAQLQVELAVDEANAVNLGKPGINWVALPGFLTNLLEHQFHANAFLRKALDQVAAAEKAVAAALATARGNPTLKTTTASVRLATTAGFVEAAKYAAGIHAGCAKTVLNAMNIVASVNMQWGFLRGLVDQLGGGGGIGPRSDPIIGGSGPGSGSGAVEYSGPVFGPTNPHVPMENQDVDFTSSPFSNPSYQRVETGGGAWRSFREFAFAYAMPQGNVLTRDIFDPVTQTLIAPAGTVIEAVSGPGDVRVEDGKIIVSGYYFDIAYVDDGGEAQHCLPPPPPDPSQGPQHATLVAGQSTSRSWGTCSIRVPTTGTPSTAGAVEHSGFTVLVATAGAASTGLFLSQHFDVTIAREIPPADSCWHHWDSQTSAWVYDAAIPGCGGSGGLLP